MTEIQHFSRGLFFIGAPCTLCSCRNSAYVQWLMSGLVGRRRNRNTRTAVHRRKRIGDWAFVKANCNCVESAGIRLRYWWRRWEAAGDAPPCWKSAMGCDPVVRMWITDDHSCPLNHVLQFTARRYASAVYVLWPGCPSVCPSQVGCFIKTAKRNRCHTMFFGLSISSHILFSSTASRGLSVIAESRHLTVGHYKQEY